MCVSVCACTCVCGGVEGEVKSEKAVPLQVGKVPVATNMRNRREELFSELQKEQQRPHHWPVFQGEDSFLYLFIDQEQQDSMGFGVRHIPEFEFQLQK